MQWTDEERARLTRAGATVLSEADGQDVATAIVEQAFPWAGILDPLVLLDENTSNYPALVRAGPLVGYVVHFRHDDEPVVLCRSVQAYLEAVRQTGELPGDSLLDPDEERTDAEELAAQHLVANAFDEDDWGAIALAIPLIRANIGLLVQLARNPDDPFEIGDRAEERLARIASPDQKQRIEAGQAPAAWPVPQEVRPRVEVELPSWSRSQLGFDDAVFEGAMRVERDGNARTLVLDSPVDVTAFLDERLPDEPADTGFLEAIGRWGDGEPVALLRWFSPHHIRLTVGEEQLFDWTRTEDP